MIYIGIPYGCTITNGRCVPMRAAGWALTADEMASLSAASLKLVGRAGIPYPSTPGHSNPPCPTVTSMPKVTSQNP